MKIWPESAGVGRYFDLRSNFIRASVDYVQESPLCTTLCKDGYKVRTVEHLLSALEAMDVDNCRIEVEVLNGRESCAEVGKSLTKFVNLSFFVSKSCHCLEYTATMDFVELSFAPLPSLTRNQMQGY